MRIPVSDQQARLATNGMRVLSLPSRGSINLPISDLMVNGNFDVYPHVEEKGLLFLNFRKKMLTLSAGTYIGLIPLTPTVTVEVEPRLPVGNLARVLNVAQGILNSIPRSDRLYKSDIVLSNSVLDFMTLNLLDALKPVQESGLLKEYIIKSDVSSNPRGRIDINGTIINAWSKGQRHKLSTFHFDHTSDISINRVLKSALKFILTNPRAPSDHLIPIISSTNRSFNDLPGNILDMTDKDLIKARRISLENLLPDSRIYYRRALDISLEILSRRGFLLQGSGSDVLLQSFILNFENIFEDYLRQVLTLKSAHSPVQVSKGKKPLFDDKNHPNAEPDIVIFSPQTGKTVVAEVKYKDKPNRDDYNQIITYGVTYRTNRVILVHQNRPGSPSGLSHVGTMNGIIVDNYAFDLSRENLDNEEQSFADCLFGAVS